MTKMQHCQGCEDLFQIGHLHNGYCSFCKEKRQEQLELLPDMLTKIERAGLKDVTREANEQNGSNHWYVFAAEQNGVFYCDDMEDIFDLADNVSLKER